MSSVDGLVSGLDTSTIISQLMKIERLPQTLLSQRRTTAETQSASLSSVRTSVMALRDLTRQLRTPLTWQGLTASSSSDAVTVAARTGRVTGSVQMTVSQTAAAAAIYSPVVPSLDTVIAPGGALFSHGDGTTLGIRSITADGIPFGDLAIRVTTPTAPATITAPGPPPTLPVTVTKSNNQLDLTVNGVNQSVTLQTGTYQTVGDLRAALSTAVAANPALAGQVAVRETSDGRLELATVREGSAASLAVVGGKAAAPLGLAVTGTVRGTDGVVEVGPDGITSTITDSTPGTVFQLGAGTGTLDVTMGGPLRTGTITATNLSLGGGTLGEVVDSINRSGDLGYTAAAVNVGDGYRLQLTAKQTGAASTVDIDTSVFTGFSDPANAFTVLSTGRDAKVVVQGDTPYEITSSTNTFIDLLPGVDVTVRRATTDPVTISVDRNTAQAADKVAEVVEALNKALAGIATETAFDPDTGRGSPLTGNSAVRRAAQALTRALSDPVDGGAFASAGQIGMQLNRDGTITFDRATFLDKLDKDPAGVSAMFSTFAGGTSPGILDRLATAADDASALGRGYLTSAREAVTGRITTYTKQIEAYETRLVQREASLRRTYANLEVALSGLSSQQSWLAGQLAGLSANKS